MSRVAALRDGEKEMREDGEEEIWRGAEGGEGWEVAR
jgi:hypothetical protein